jgi:hypothetical protein
MKLIMMIIFEVLMIMIMIRTIQMMMFEVL